MDSHVADEVTRLTSKTGNPIAARKRKTGKSFVAAEVTRLTSTRPRRRPRARSVCPRLDRGRGRRTSTKPSPIASRDPFFQLQLPRAAARLPPCLLDG